MGMSSISPSRRPRHVHPLGLLGVVIVTALMLWTFWPRRTPSSADDALRQRLEAEVIALDRTEPTGGFDDLAPLKSVLAGRRVVAIGEATHGTHEFFRMKHRMFAFLVEQLGFSLFGMECGSDATTLVNDFITTGTGDAAAIANQLTYWPWATEEVRDLLIWMRDYNARPEVSNPLRFYGLDPVRGDRDAGMAERAVAILNDAGPDARMMIWAHNYHVSMADETRMGFHLKQALGSEAYLMGFEFGDGDFTSRDFTTLRVYHVDPAPVDYYASDLARLASPRLFLDVATLQGDPELANWLAQPLKTRSLDEMYYLFGYYEPWQSEQTPWPGLFDGLIFIRTTTYTHPVPGGWLPFVEPVAHP